MSIQKHRLWRPVLFVVAIWVTADMILPFMRESDEKRMTAELSEQKGRNLKKAFDVFVEDTVTGSPIGLGIDIIEIDSASGEAQIVRAWAARNGVQIDNMRRADSQNLYNRVKARAQIQALETPIGDEFHSKAFIMGKSFVKNELKKKLSHIEFKDDYRWRKTLTGYYHIASTVHAITDFGVRMTYNWEVEVKLKSGDWTDINNWEHNELHISAYK